LHWVPTPHGGEGIDQQVRMVCIVERAYPDDRGLARKSG
jgi:hypothetical protein